MQKIYPSENVYVKNSLLENAGRGVFAKRDIRKGEVVETCPVIEIPTHDVSAVNKSILLTYFFFHGKKKEKIWLALGYGSLYNHSYTANVMYIINERNGTIDFVALSDIAKDSEITFDYKGESLQNNPLWFEVA